MAKDASDSREAVIVAASILSADFARLGEEINKAEEAGADRIHLDVMDGHFVPNITFGPGLVKSVRKVTRLPLDVHLMIYNPEMFIPRFVDAGADSVTVHFEASVHLHRNLQAIKNLGIKAGVSLNPHNPPSLIDEILEDMDLVLVMSVNPGFGGQTFIERSLDKIRALRTMISQRKCNCLIAVDGGINDSTGRQCVEAGVDILVAGHYIFSYPDYREAIRRLKKTAV